MNVSGCEITLLNHKFLSEIPALLNSGENGFGLFYGYSSGLMALPNNGIRGCVEGGHNEQAGNDLFDHLASHI